MGKPRLPWSSRSCSQSWGCSLRSPQTCSCTVSPTSCRHLQPLWGRDLHLALLISCAARTVSYLVGPMTAKAYEQFRDSRNALTGEFMSQSFLRSYGECVSPVSAKLEFNFPVKTACRGVWILVSSVSQYVSLLFISTAFVRMWPALDTSLLVRALDRQAQRWRGCHSATDGTSPDGRNINFFPETSYSLQQKAHVMKT